MEKITKNQKIVIFLYFFTFFCDFFSFLITFTQKLNYFLIYFFNIFLHFFVIYLFLLSNFAVLFFIKKTKNLRRYLFYKISLYFCCLSYNKENARQNKRIVI